LQKASQFVVYRSTSRVMDINLAENILAITNTDATAFTDTTVIPGTKYYYRVTALDRFHNESRPSKREKVRVQGEQAAIVHPWFEKHDKADKRLSIKVRPNPSADQFILLVQSKTEQPLRISVADNNGRIVETRNNVTPNSTIMIGSEYPTGIYYVVVMQGNVRQTIKLVKIRN